MISRLKNVDVLVILGALVPWLVAAAVAGGPSTALMFLLVLVVCGGVGYPVLVACGPALAPNARLLLAPAAGFVVAAGVGGLALRLGVAPRLVGDIILLAGLAGLPLTARRILRTEPADRLRARFLVLISAAVCAVYYLPLALVDATTLADGTFRWAYVDTQYFMSMAASTMVGDGPPSLPGMALADLVYHFGTYGFSGALAAATGFDLADMGARVVRGVLQFSLVMGVYGLGSVAGLYLGAKRWAGPAAAVGLFAYGSLGTFFAERNLTSSAVSEPLLFKLPYLAVPTSGGPFTHVMLGHTGLGGLLGLTVVVALLLAAFRPGAGETWRRIWPVFLLPAVFFPVNSVAGTGAIGLVMALPVVMRPRDRVAWLGAAVALATTVASAAILGYINDTKAGMRLEPDPATVLFPLFIWFTIGLGIRVAAFDHARRWRTDALAFAVVFLAAGFVLFSAVLRNSYWGIDRYGLFYAQGVLSALGFAIFGADWEVAWREGRSFLATLAGRVLPTLAVGAAAFLGLALVARAAELVSGAEPLFVVSLTMRAAALLLAFAATALLLRRRFPLTGRWLGGVVVGVYALGALAWIGPLSDHGFDRLRVRVDLDPGFTAALRDIRDLAPTDALLATNRDAVASLPSRPERSYAVTALSERRVLLEGWRYGESFEPGFEAVRVDRDSLFATRDAVRARTIVDRYGIDYIVPEPGRPFALGDRPPAWLREVTVGSGGRYFRVDAAAP